MKIKLRLVIFFLLTVFFGFFSTKTALADTFTLSGSVQTASGSAIAGATVSVNDTNNDSTTSNSSGNYILSVPSGTYNIQVTPPSGSGFSSAISFSQTINSNTTLNFVLTPAGTVTLSGHLYDALGNPLTGQTVQLQGNSSPQVTTDSTGHFSFQVSAGTYNFVISDSNNSLSVNAPQDYNVIAYGYSLTQDTNLDITLPFKKVTVQTQDSSKSPVSGVRIDVLLLDTANTNLPLGGSLPSAVATGGYDSGKGPKTDSSGNANVWLFPNSTGKTYQFDAVPPSGNIYSTTILAKQNITSDTNLTITMQQPVTLSGHLYDALGNPLANQTVQLQGGSSPQIKTDANGSYSLQASPGTYNFIIEDTNNSLSTNAPQDYHVIVYGYSLTQNTTLNITLPFKKVVIHAQDAFGNPVSGVRIDVPQLDTANTNLPLGGSLPSAVATGGYDSGTGPKTDTSGDATVWLFPNGNNHAYKFDATPLSGSGYSTTTLSNRSITADTNLTITLQKPVTFSGHLYDALGNPLVGQTVQLQGGSNPQTTTDSTGSYTIQTVAGTYTLVYKDSNNSLSVNAPQDYTVTDFNYVISQSTNLDITFPLKKVIVHVQDSTGRSVSGIRIDVPILDYANKTLSLDSSVMNAWVDDGYDSGTGPTTDSLGNATVWLFPNGENYTSSFVATPPTGSIYSTFTLSNITVTSDPIQNELVSLQYNHAIPVTTANIITQNNDGTYSNPTTVTLSATAASAYTIANTYYTVDGGTQQTYSNPFTVTGSGSHTITYWSVDNSGIQETHQTKTFTIHTNQPPHVNPLSGGSINANSTYAETGSFTDTDSTSWTATVDYGDGAGPQPVPLNADKTFALSHQYTTAGSYTISVVVTDGQYATGTTVTTVAVNNVPQISTLSGTTILSGDTYTENGSFTDSDSTSWTATVNYGDGTGDQPLTVSGKNFSLNHAYPTPGNYTVTVKVTDNQGATGTGTATVLVNNRPPHVNPLSGATVNEGGTYTQDGTFTDPDSTSWTAVADYGDGSGQQVVTLNTDKTFSLSHPYKDNGTYTVIVVITDNQQNTGTTMTNVTVNNTIPSIGAITASINPILINTATTASASFTDAGVLDTHTAVWNWGDGSTTNGTVTETNGSGTISDSHSYTAPGVYEISLTITDKDNGQKTVVYQYLVAYDTTTKSVSGTKEFTSPAGALTANPSVSGTANFGFTAQYDNAGNVMPIGNKWGSITLKSGTTTSVDFNATTYTALVVSGAKVTLQGTGTYNGTAGYTVLITAIDGSQTGGQDLIRYQIKDASGTVVYDTQPGAALTADPTTPVSKGKITVK